MDIDLPTILARIVHIYDNQDTDFNGVRLREIQDLVSDIYPPEATWNSVFQSIRDNDPENIYSPWSIQDVQGQEAGEYLTDVAARAVLMEVEDAHNTEVGINWDVIDDITYNYIEEKGLEAIKPEFYRDSDMYATVFNMNWYDDIEEVMEALDKVEASPEDKQFVVEMAERLKLEEETEDSEAEDFDVPIREGWDE